MRALICLLAVACSSGPKTSAPKTSAPLQSTVASKITGGAVTFTDWSISHVGSLFFTDGGQRLVAATYGSFVEIDPIARRQVGWVSLDSPTVPNPKGRTGVGETLSWTVHESVWAWDAGSVIGVVNLGAWGDAVSGLALWRPASGTPIAIPAPSGYLCEPLAISHDRKAFATRVDTSKRGCGPAQTGVQVFSIETQEALSPPMELGFTRRAAFSRDGRLVAAGGKRSVQVMDLRERKVIARLPIKHELTALAFHPRTSTVAWTNDDGELESWAIGDSAPVSRGRGQGIAFSPDGRLAATNRDGRVVLLDATTFDILGAPLEGVRGTSTDVISFSEDGTQLAVAISGTQIGVWQLEPRGAVLSESGWLQRLRPLPTPAPKPFPRIDRDGRLEGRVLVGGKPVANAVVTLEPHHQEYEDARALPRLTTRTKADGSYLFENVPTITWQQLVRAPGATIGGYIYPMREQKAHKTDVRLDPAVTIRGKVIGPDNAPVRGAAVFHAATYSADELELVTDANGRFVIDHLRPSRTYAISVRRADGAVRSKTFDISKPGPIDTTLKLAAANDPDVVHFIVVDKAGAPVAGARVMVEMQAGKADASGKASIDVDTSVSGGKGLRAQVVNKETYPISEATRIDVPQPTPVTPVKLVVER